MKKCTRCRNNFKVNDFKIINKRTGKRSSMCPDCRRSYDREYWEKNRTKLHNQRRDKRDRNRRFIASILKESECVDCGNSNWMVLEFDHLRDKSFNISSAGGTGYSIESIKREIEKCDIVCANCHRIRTIKQFGYYSRI